MSHEHAGGGLAHRLMIVDQQDAQRPALGRAGLVRRPAPRGLAARLRRRARQPDLDPRALADLAVDVDRAARLAGEAVDHRQAEAGALADVLGGEEGLGHLLQYVGGMPLPLSATASTT